MTFCGRKQVYIKRPCAGDEAEHSSVCRSVNVVLEAEAQLQIRPVELMRQRRKIGSFNGSPGCAVERHIAGAACKDHGVGLQASVGQDGEDNLALAALED